MSKDLFKDFEYDNDEVSEVIMKMQKHKISQWLKDNIEYDPMLHDDMLDEIRELEDDDFYINDDLTISLEASFTFPKDLTELPLFINFSDITGNIIIEYGSELKSFRGFPPYIDGCLILRNGDLLFEDIPKVNKLQIDKKSSKRTITLEDIKKNIKGKIVNIEEYLYNFHITCN